MKKEILDIVISGLSSVYGISENELKNNPDVDLFELEIFDSLSIITLMTYLEKKLDRKMSISDFSFDDFGSPSKLAQAVERLAGR